MQDIILPRVDAEIMHRRKQASAFRCDGRPTRSTCLLYPGKVSALHGGASHAITPRACYADLSALPF